MNWRAIVLLAIGPIGFLSVELLSEYAGRVYGADESVIGWLAGAEAGAAALTSLLLYLFPRFQPKNLIPMATTLFWVANFGCLSATSLFQLSLLCLVMGATAGIICSKSYQILTTENAPTRQLGAVIALQAAALSLSFIIIPYLTPLYGGALFIVIGGWLSLCLICCIGLKEPQITSEQKVASSNIRRIWFFVSVITFYACHGGYNAFIAELASQEGMPLITTGWVLTAGCAVGLITGIWSMLEQNDDNQTNSIIRSLLVAFACTFIATALLLKDEFDLYGYLLSVVLYNFGWCFAIPYQVQAAANLNDGGRASSLLLFLQAFGMALGAISLGQFAVVLGIPIALNILIPIAGGISVIAMINAERPRSIPASASNQLS